MDSPVMSATWQAALLSATSNILAQLLTCWRANAPFTVNLVNVFHFTLFAALVTPPNVVWQAWLEAQFPAHSQELAPREKEAVVDEAVAARTKTTGDTLRRRNGEEKSSAGRRAGSRTLNKKNTAIKFVLDQTAGSVVNNLLFIAGIGLIRGQTASEIQGDIAKQFIPTMAAGLKLWPLVSILNFTLVPLEYRMLLGNAAGLFWGIYLSLATSSN